MEIIAYQKESYHGIHELLKEEGWLSFIDTHKSAYEKALERSISYVAMENGKIIGYIRAISDNVYLTFIAELVVAKNYRKKHIGTSLIKHIEINHPTCKVELISDADLFYQKNGFQIVGTGQRKN